MDSFPWLQVGDTGGRHRSLGLKFGPKAIFLQFHLFLQICYLFVSYIEHESWRKGCIELRYHLVDVNSR